jgi:hypothetical protein
LDLFFDVKLLKYERLISVLRVDHYLFVPVNILMTQNDETLLTCKYQ